MKKETARFSIGYTYFLDEEGNPTEDFPNDISTEQVVEWYKTMVLTRTFNKRAIELQRTGQCGTFASSEGQEAVGVGYASAMRKEDVLVGPYREYAAQMIRASSAEEAMAKALLYWGGDERGSSLDGAPYDFPSCVPIATQACHAVGIADPDKRRVAVCVLGDGATSKGDFYESMNLAGVWNLPVVFLIINNQWAISLSRKRQTNALTLAQKGVAAGIRNCYQVDGNDVVAVYMKMREAVRRAREGQGPTVLEAITYRLGNHTTADDAKRYRSQEEVEEARTREPLRRTRAYLEHHQAWGEQKETALLHECEKRVAGAIEKYLDTVKNHPQSTADMFQYLHAELPQALAPQLEEALKYSKKGGA